MKKLRRNLRAFRHANGYSTDEMATMLGITVQTYMNYERGARHPNILGIEQFVKNAGLVGDISDLIMLFEITEEN